MAQQLDSFDFSSLLGEYFDAMKYEPVEVKQAETDYIISAVEDSVLRNRVALEVYSHYIASPVMGDEAVAIHVFDKWFDTGIASMDDETALLNARIFAEFNRRTLLGCKAPVLELYDMDGNLESLPCRGHTSVLFFYDTECAKCRMQSILLGNHFSDAQALDLDFYAVYAGDNESAWKNYVQNQLDFHAEGLRMHHLWDKEGESDMLRTYGLLQTPRMFLVDAHGEIIGRGLDAGSLMQMLSYASAIQQLYDRCPLGATLPSMDLQGQWVRRTLWGRLFGGEKGIASDRKEMTLSKLKGNPCYLVLYSPSCTHCQEELEGVSRMILSSRNVSAFLVNVDEIYENDPELGTRILDTFDLTVLPYILTLDKKGIITDRYITFVE